MRRSPALDLSTSLPVPLASLIGREREVGELTAMLAADDVRLVTLTGPGGAGKTRLAIAVSAAFQQHHAVPVVFVDLSAMFEPNQVATAIAEAFGVHEPGVQWLPGCVAALAPGHRLLLLLDNFEQVVDAAPLAAELLGQATGVTALVTSREPLKIAGEHAYPLEPLALPESNHGTVPVALGEFAAVRLFEARARAVDPSFRLTPANATTVAGICALLDGLPLAIELAAVHLKLLGLGGLHARLASCLPLPATRRRDLPQRQRTMHQTVAWSHALLSEDQQALFHRLAVFVGGFGLEAAETVAAGLDALDGLASLVDKNLVRRNASLASAGEPRFSMLETIRAFGADRLRESGEEPNTRLAHARWCIEFAESAALAKPFGPNQSASPARIDPELPNIRAAADWLLATGDTAGAMRLVTALSSYWIQRSLLFREVRSWLEAALASDSTATPGLRVLALELLSEACAITGDGAAALEHGQAALAGAEAIGDPLLIGRAFADLGLAWEHLGDGERSATALESAVSNLRRSGDRWMLAAGLAELGDKLVWLGRVASGVAALDEALAQVRAFEDSWLLAITLGQRGYAALAQADAGLAATLFAESITGGRRAGDERVVVGGVAGLAAVAFTAGEPMLAVELLGAVDAAGEMTGTSRFAHRLHADRTIDAARSTLAPDVFATAWATGRARDWDTVVESALEWAVHTSRPMVAGSAEVDFGLTSREREVLRLLVAGKSDKQIADALFIGVRTVQTHVANMLAKLEAANRAEAAVFAVRHGLA